MQDPALVRLGPGECELRSGAAVDEQPLTGTERQGKDEQMQLVDKPVGEQRPHEGAAATDVEVLAGRTASIGGTCGSWSVTGKARSTGARASAG